MPTQPPDLQTMVATFGTYADIPAVAWKSYDRQMTAWRAAVRHGDRYYPTPPDRPRPRANPNAKRTAQPQQGEQPMDISDQISSGGFIRVADLADGPRQAVIADVRKGKFKGPDMELQDGSILSLNATNLKKLAAAWGNETDAWIGKEIELYVGQTKFQDETLDSVLVKPISPPIPLAERPKPVPKTPPSRRPATTSQDDFNDEIPF